MAISQQSIGYSSGFISAVQVAAFETLVLELLAFSWFAQR